MADGLRLRAGDAEDLGVISAVLQDAILPIGEMAYLPDEGCFVLVANRFRWEGEGKAPAGPTPDEPVAGERVHSAVRFHKVAHVACRGLDLKRRDQFLSLLSLEAMDGAILLHMAAGADIRLTVSEIDCVLEDIGLPWPAGSRPVHPD